MGEGGEKLIIKDTYFALIFQHGSFKKSIREKGGGQSTGGGVGKGKEGGRNGAVKGGRRRGGWEKWKGERRGGKS